MVRISQKGALQQTAEKANFERAYLMSRLTSSQDILSICTSPQSKQVFYKDLQAPPVSFSVNYAFTKYAWRSSV